MHAIDGTQTTVTPSFGPRYHLHTPPPHHTHTIPSPPTSAAAAAAVTATARTAGQQKKGARDASRLEPLVLFFFVFFFPSILMIYTGTIYVTQATATISGPNDAYHVVWALGECFFFNYSLILHTYYYCI